MKTDLNYMIAVMQAAKEGKLIQCKNKLVDNSEWEDYTDEIEWDWHVFDFRVKEKEASQKSMSEYVKYCTVEQTKQAYKLNAPLESLSEGSWSAEMDDGTFVLIPTTQEMIEWLRDKGFYFSFADEINFDSKEDVEPICFYKVNNNVIRFWTDKEERADTHYLAELDAINKALNILETKLN